MKNIQIILFVLLSIFIGSSAYAIMSCPSGRFVQNHLAQDYMQSHGKKLPYSAPITKAPNSPELTWHFISGANAASVGRDAAAYRARLNFLGATYYDGQQTVECYYKVIAHDVHATFIIGIKAGFSGKLVLKGNNWQGGRCQGEVAQACAFELKPT